MPIVAPGSLGAHADVPAAAFRDVHANIDVLAQHDEYPEQPIDGKPARVAIHQGAHFRLVYSGLPGRLCLRKPESLDRAHDRYRKVRLEQQFTGPRQAHISEDVSAAFADLSCARVL